VPPKTHGPRIETFIIDDDLVGEATPYEKAGGMNARLRLT
jgi:hypothetical protein